MSNEALILYEYVPVQAIDAPTIMNGLIVMNFAAIKGDCPIEIRESSSAIFKRLIMVYLTLDECKLPILVMYSPVTA